MQKGSLILIMLISCLAVVTAASPSLQYHVNFQDGSASTTSEFQFNITTSPDCSDVIYTNTTTLTSNGAGNIDYYLTKINNTAAQNQLYLCIYKSGSLFENISIALVPQCGYSLNVSAAGIVDNANITLPNYDIDVNGVFARFYNWTVSSIYAAFNGNTLTIDDGLLNTNFNQTDQLTSINTTANIFSLINETNGWNLTFDYLFSKDWSNVTITESQVTDLSHTVDTNESARVEFLVNSDCALGDVAIDVLVNGSLNCSSSLAGNSSWAQSLADTLYSDILWNYNQTDTQYYYNMTDTQYYYNMTVLDTDTNESTRIEEAIAGDCGAGTFAVGLETNGSFLCLADSISNETDLILTVNTTTNIEALGFTQGAHTVDTDTNASTECATDEVLLGNTSCRSSDSFLDDTTIPDTNESTRIENAVSGDCITGTFAIGLETNGSLLCLAETISNETDLVLTVNTTDNIKALINNTDNWVLSFDTILSRSWSNVTITESQVTDLSHTVDTNASTECATDEVLLGNASCMSTSGFFDDTTIPDTNETARIIALIDVNCSIGDFVTDVYSNGSLECRTANTITDTNESDRVETLWNNETYSYVSNETDLIGTVNTTTNIFSLINNTIGWIMNFSKIYSKDWSNVTITESQITDLSHTVDTDTNASTECAGDEVLLGNTSCMTSSSFGGAGDGTGGWTNTSDDTNTTLAVNINTNNMTIRDGVIVIDKFNTGLPDSISPAAALAIQNNETGSAIQIQANSTKISQIFLGDSFSVSAGKIAYANAQDRMRFGVADTNELDLISTSLYPVSDLGLSLGLISNRWDGLWVDLDSVVPSSADAGMSVVYTNTTGGVYAMGEKGFFGGLKFTDRDGNVIVMNYTAGVLTNCEKAGGVCI